MKICRDISYAPEYGQRGLADLYLPDGHLKFPLALVIHGGGWQSADKHSLAPVAQLLAENGWAAFAINYRLIDGAPWPACAKDCLAAARFLLNAVAHPILGKCRRNALLIIGASAGAHLALMTALRLPREAVLGIISIAGPTDLQLLARQKAKQEFPAVFWQRFFGKGIKLGHETFAAASPVHGVPLKPPPLLCVHSTRDELVPVGHSERLVEIWRRQGGRAELACFEGRDDQHGIWEPGATRQRLAPEVAGALTVFAGKLLKEIHHD